MDKAEGSEMQGEDWELRREARRYRYSALQAKSPQSKRMFAGYARFYDCLAATEVDSSLIKTSHGSREKREDRAALMCAR